MDRNGGYVTYGVHIPDLAEKLFLGKYVVRIAGEEGQKIEFLGGKDLLLSVYVDPPCSLIDLYPPDLNNIIFRSVLLPAHWG